MIRLKTGIIDPKEERQKMTKTEAILKAKDLTAQGREIRVAYQVITHANRNGAQKVSFTYRLVENGKIIA